jgi:hypothetical protein
VRPIPYHPGSLRSSRTKTRMTLNILSEPGEVEVPHNNNKSRICTLMFIIEPYDCNFYISKVMFLHSQVIPSKDLPWDHRTLGRWICK